MATPEGPSITPKDLIPKIKKLSEGSIVTLGPDRLIKVPPGKEQAATEALIYRRLNNPPAEEPKTEST